MLIALMLLVTGCGKQTASAYISDGTAGTTAIIRLNGGWSVDFAGDCFSLYDGEITENADCKAIGIVIDESTFKDYMKEAQESKMGIAKQPEAGLFSLCETDLVEMIANICMFAL